MNDTLKYIETKYNLDLNQEMPILIPIGRFKDIPRLFKELNFKVGAEIGVFEGEYSRWLFKGIPNLQLALIDKWQPYAGYNDFQDKKITDAYNKTKENVKGYNYLIFKMPSDEAVKQFKDESLDFVFIDGNHSYEHTVQDIALWSPKVRKGGIVYGHDFDDYSNNRRWKDMNVINAVEGWVKSYKIKPWFVITHNRNKCWLWVKE